MFATLYAKGRQLLPYRDCGSSHTARLIMGISDSRLTIKLKIKVLIKGYFRRDCEFIESLNEKDLKKGRGHFCTGILTMVFTANS